MITGNLILVYFQLAWYIVSSFNALRRKLLVPLCLLRAFAEKQIFVDLLLQVKWVQWQSYLLFLKVEYPKCTRGGQVLEASWTPPTAECLLLSWHTLCEMRFKGSWEERTQREKSGQTITMEKYSMTSISPAFKVLLKYKYTCIGSKMYSNIKNKSVHCKKKIIWKLKSNKSDEEYTLYLQFSIFPRAQAEYIL